MNLVEGARVSYVGDQREGLVIGDRGKVLLRDGQASHVRWESGTQEGNITLVSDLDLVVTSAHYAYEDDSLDSKLVHVAVGDTFGRFGHKGLFNALNDEGHFATLEPVIEEAAQTMVAQVREDPSIKEVLAELDSEDGTDFLMYATMTLFRELFDEGE